ncbi:hypothetical protein A3759_12150 [Thalassolituus sp. HI0120]|jgi:type IV secretion system protein VirB7|nr:hypothetical protein A3759_12150 [Thalassolituus sp. HI0120]
MKKLVVTCILVSGLAGCTTAGPFITNIDRQNNDLIIDKCYVHVNGFWGTVSKTDCSQESLDLKGL